MSDPERHEIYSAVRRVQGRLRVECTCGGVLWADDMDALHTLLAQHMGTRKEQPG